MRFTAKKAREIAQSKLDFKSDRFLKVIGEIEELANRGLVIAYFDKSDIDTNTYNCLVELGYEFRTLFNESCYGQDELIVHW